VAGPSQKCGKQPLDETSGLARLDVGGERLAVVDAVHRVLYVTLGAEHQRRRGTPGRQVGQMLRGQGVQPGKAVGAGDANDAAMGQVDEALIRLQRPLLVDERAVVRRHGRVDPAAAHRIGKPEQRTPVVSVHVLILTHIACASTTCA
jgi:hypothetical protein